MSATTVQTESARASAVVPLLGPLALLALLELGELIDRRTSSAKGDALTARG